MASAQVEFVDPNGHRMVFSLNDVTGPHRLGFWRHSEVGGLDFEVNGKARVRNVTSRSVDLGWVGRRWGFMKVHGA